ncbi:MAG: hypothetical protein H7Y04_14320 [Verrucomicrobia bacterium]|nr:hypothetical protein [Cytophagales bacterium]
MKARNIIFINLGIVLLYNALITLYMKNTGGNEAGLGILVFSAVCVSAHFFINILAGLVFLAQKKTDYGRAFLFSALIIGLVGFGTCVLAGMI